MPGARSRSVRSGPGGAAGLPGRTRNTPGKAEFRRSRKRVAPRPEAIDRRSLRVSSSGRARVRIAAGNGAEARGFGRVLAEFQARHSASSRGRHLDYRALRRVRDGLFTALRPRPEPNCCDYVTRRPKFAAT
ncbi:hypothetical protein JCM2811A_24410 [Methylorubrum rhodinum]